MSNQNLINDLRDMIEGNIENRKTWFDESVESRNLIDFLITLPELPEEPSLSSCDDDTIFFSFRYDKFLKTEVRKIMLENGFDINYEVKEESITNGYSHPLISFSGNNEEYNQYRFWFKFDDSKDESTCKREVIGEEMKMTKIYEWNCEEEA